MILKFNGKAKSQLRELQGHARPHLVADDRLRLRFLESSNDRCHFFIPINAYMSAASRLYYSDFVHSFQVQRKIQNVRKLSKYYIELCIPIQY